MEEEGLKAGVFGSVDNPKIAEEAKAPIDDMFAPEELDSELGFHINTSPRSGMQVLQHPLVYQVPYTPLLNKQANQILRYKRESLVEAERERKWGLYILLYERPYRNLAFKEIADKLTDEEYWDIFRDVYIDTENQWQWRRDLRRFFTKRPHPEQFMREEERATLAQMKRNLTIYRGIQKLGHKAGWSWTLDKEQAIWFARRYLLGPHGLVLTGMCSTFQVNAYISSRGEEEIVIDPKHVALLKSEKVFPKPRS